MGIEESSNLSELKVENLIGNLQTYKVKLEARERENGKEYKKKDVAFKANFPSSSDEEAEEEAYYLRGHRLDKASRLEKVRCFECNEKGHFKDDNPILKKKKKPSKYANNKKVKMTHKATWDSVSSKCGSKEDDCM